MINLLPNYSHSTIRETSHPLDTAPDFVSSGGATRWHRARSGSVFPDGRTAYNYWCGSGTPAGIGSETVPDDDLLCGTCEGRWEAQQNNRLVFTPRKALPPTRCPASRRAWFQPNVRNPFPCPACGASVKVTCRWYSGPSIQTHPTGPSLVSPCPYHGWNRMWMDRQGKVVCACTIREGAWP